MKLFWGICMTAKAVKDCKQYLTGLELNCIVEEKYIAFNSEEE